MKLEVRQSAMAAIASIIRQVAPEAKIGSFRVLGEQLRSRTAIICEGARLALDCGYQVLNCSFGCGREDHVLQTREARHDAGQLERAADPGSGAPAGRGCAQGLTFEVDLARGGQDLSAEQVQDG